MQQTFKQRSWKIGKWFIILFFAMFLFRLIYGYVSTEISNNNDFSNDFFSSVDNLRKNYASNKFESNNNIGIQASMASSQKYEKTATVKSKSTQFETDENSIKTVTKNFEGVIQYEQNTGNKGSRELHLLIGINPEKFDSFYIKVQKIGFIKSTEITKIDKTNEYRQLNAKKTSIEKALTSLNELKSKAGDISDYISLHDKILETESRMQELGVELGNFDTENEFCSIKFSLYEGATKKAIGVMARIKVAFEWTIKYYAILILSLLGISGLVLILLVMIDKLKILKTISSQLND